MAVRIEHRAEPIPGYRLIDRLGGGGFGEVWRAEAPGGLYKAIKFVFGDLSCANDNGQRAEQELKALKRVQSVRHPYILSLDRYDIIDGQLMIVMELADRNLWDRFKECRTQGLPGIPRAELLGYMSETAEALDLMNGEYQLQHLDIKPQNIFLVHQHIKVADFGLVKDLEGSHASVTGGITPVYAAPETFDGKVTRYSDQYSLGILFQELLTGQRPFNGVNVRQLILQHLQATPDVSPLPQGDRPHIARALSKVPHARFPTCRDLVEALKGSTRSSGKESAAAAPPSQPAVTTSTTAPPTSLVSPLSSGPISASLRGQTTDHEYASEHGVRTTYNIRAIDLAMLKNPESPAVTAPPEIKGTGTLFPAVIVGLGQVGLTVMQRLREELTTSVAPAGLLPHLRFSLIDTDPEVMRLATRGNPSASLSASEVILAPLNRPSYYLKPSSTRPILNTWLNPRILYRIPRSQVTTGVRALGRLAYIDNYRVIIRRLQTELEAAVEPKALQDSAAQTGLGVRSNRPRVYILTSLAGGTGSGMFLDVAYTVRALLKQMGYENPDVVGLLLLPPVDNNRTRLLPLGNAYAALTELNYFGGAGIEFKAKYHESEAPIEDDGPPFTRTIVLPMPDESDETAMQETIDSCAQMLIRDLTAPLGRAVDLGRAGLTAPPWETRGQYCQTFGLFQLTCPRHALLQAAGRELCRRVMQRWLSRDSKPLREAVQTWVDEQWSLHELGADTFIHRLQADVVKELGEPPDSLFAALVSTIKTGSAQGVVENKKQLKGAEANVVGELLARLEELVGRPTPSDELAPETPPRLVQLLCDKSSRLSNQWGHKLAELPVRLMEEPAFRLAGGEEAIRQLMATVESVLQHHEPLARDLSRKATEAYQYLRECATASSQGVRRPVISTSDLADLVRVYAKSRYQSLVLNHLTGAFVALRGHLSDELREINFCRIRLNELLSLVEAADPGDMASRPADSTGASEIRLTPVRSNTEARIGRLLFASGCRDLREATDLYLESVTPEDVVELDGRMEEMLRSNFTALVNVCLSTQANMLKSVSAAMLRTARDFVGEHVPATSVSALFFENHAEDPTGEIMGEIASFHDEAAPELSLGRRLHQRNGNSPPVSELRLLAAPEDEAGERFRKLLETVVPDAEFLRSGSNDDIVIYRERNNLALTELDCLGPLGHDAYVQLNTAENFTPHARCDIDFRVTR
jgi:serine/threonine protein kinase